MTRELPTSSPPKRPQTALLATVALVSIAVAGIVALELSGSGWGLALALAATAAGGVGAVLGVRALLSDDDGTAMLSPGRRATTVMAAAAVLALAGGAIALHEDAATADAAKPDTAGAKQTLRDFLAQAVLEDNAYPACQYLTAAQQLRVERLAGGRQTCRAVFTTTRPRVGGVTSRRGLERLKLQARPAGGDEAITVTGPGTQPLHFTLRRATPADYNGFEAPNAAWRISAGVGALLPAPAGRTVAS